MNTKETDWRQLLEDLNNVRSGRLHADIFFPAEFMVVAPEEVHEDMVNYALSCLAKTLVWVRHPLDIAVLRRAVDAYRVLNEELKLLHHVAEAEFDPNSADGIAIFDAMNAALAILQEHVGQRHGDFASGYFSEDFNGIAPLLQRYLNAERTGLGS